MFNLSINESIATAVLDRPPVNAIDYDWVDTLNAALDQVEKNKAVSVLHLRSSSKIFCAGADLALMESMVCTPEGCEEMVELIRKVQRALDRLETIGVVTVAELGGAALGGGFELALACDLRVASKKVKLGLPEVGLGLIPGAGGTQRLTRICGENVARRIILGAEVVNGEEAARLGMVQWAIEHDALPAWTGELVNKLGGLPRQAIAASKRCIEAAYTGSADGYEMELVETRTLYGDPDSQKLIQAFLQKSVSR
jgi:enoyl-CoA hydratase/carnithine racemase